MVLVSALLALLAMAVALQLVRPLGLRFVVILLFAAWLSPLLLDAVLPLSVPYPFNPWVVGSALLSIGVIGIAPITALGVRAERLHVDGRSTRRRPFGWIVSAMAWLGVFFIYADFLVLREIDFSGDLYANRERYLEGSVLAQWTVVLLPFSFLSWAKWNRARPVWQNALFLLPYLLIALAYLMAGNRQYFVFGILLGLILYALSSRGSIKRRLAVVLALGFILFAGMLWFQFKRQPFAVDSQAEFLTSISGIECSGPLCESSLLTPMLYLYQYFGIEYRGLSALVYLREEVGIGAQPLSLTLPVLYRRLQPLAGLPDHDAELLRLYDEFEAQYGYFPRFWKTMFGAVFQEWGWVGMIVATWALMLAHLVALRVHLVSRSGVSRLFLAAFYASVIFGVMFNPLFEPLLFVFTVIGMAYWSYVMIRPLAERLLLMAVSR